MEKIQLKRLVEHCVDITSSIIIPEITPKGCILVRSPDGTVYEDDVTTHHLVELLTQLDSERFSSIIKSAIEWFVKERSDLHNPFFVDTIISARSISDKDIKKLIEKSILLRKRKSGLIYMYAAFLDGGDIFSTLWATRILLSTPIKNEYSETIKEALVAVWKNWNDIHRTSFKGFFLELLLKAKIDNDLPNPKTVIDEIIHEQKENYLWDSSYLYTFYILGNLASAADEYPYVLEIIEETLIKLFELNKDLDGPPAFIKETLNKSVESLFLQTCIRAVISADKYLKLIGFGNEIPENLTNKFVGTWPILFYRNRVLEARVKEMESQYENIEKEFKHIRRKVRKLLEESPYEKNVFIMMPLTPYLKGKKLYVELVKEVKNTLKKEGFRGWVATDIQLDSVLWNNVAAYMEACKYGIAIFTRRKRQEEDKIIEEEYFNPNVSLEIGFMLARGKKVLILKDKPLQKMATDLVGHLYEEFDLENPESVRRIIRKWIREIKGEEQK